MQKSILQFHALPEEVISRLNTIVSDTYVVAGIRLGPPFMIDDLSWPVPLGTSADRLVIGTLDFDKTATPLQTFAERNHDCLYVELPFLGTNGLIEGSIGYVVGNGSGVAKNWAAIVNKFKKTLFMGGVAINPISGGRAVMKSHRFSEGALKLQRTGTVMRPSAGNAVVMLDDVK